MAFHVSNIPVGWFAARLVGETSVGTAGTGGTVVSRRDAEYALAPPGFTPATCQYYVVPAARFTAPNDVPTMPALSAKSELKRLSADI